MDKFAVHLLGRIPVNETWSVGNNTHKYTYTAQILCSNGKTVVFEDQEFTPVSRGDIITISGYNYEVITVQHVPTKDPVLHCRHKIGDMYG